MKRLRLLVPTLARLGVSNLARVAAYRAALRSGRLARRLPVGEPYPGPFFQASGGAPPALTTDASAGLGAEVEALHAGTLTYFSCHRFTTGAPPDWFVNPFLSTAVEAPSEHWSRLGDFDSGAGDIKTIWEPSRLDWVLTLARAYRLWRREADLRLLNDWLADWVAHNPHNRGPNWKCGQETSLRLLHVLLAARLLDQERSPTPALIRFVVEHGRRVRPSMHYAIAQDNNHGTSEAAALLVGGLWLSRASTEHADEGRRWAAVGRHWLEERVAHLVEPDGSFSQASLTYHRMFLDTLSHAALWLRWLDEPPLSERLESRLRAAVEWLCQMVSPTSGDGPNLGANDGTHPFRLAGLDYRDFRPSVQLGAVIWRGRPAYLPGPWDEPLAWLGLTAHEPAEPAKRRSRAFDDGGYVTLAAEGAWALVRTPRGRFRPSQADALHLDLWVGDDNVLRDAGTYSYRPEPGFDVDLAATRSHNTVTFDDRDQMPRLGRFLYGAWLRVQTDEPLRENPDGPSWAGHYQDAWGARHDRRVQVAGRCWTITDTVTGFRRAAVLHWRLAPGAWTLVGNRCEGPWGVLEITNENGPSEVKLVQQWESRCYMERTPLPVLEVTVYEPTTLTTRLHLSS